MAMYTNAATVGVNSLTPLAYTALPIAAARTIASDRGILDDPLAKKLLGTETRLLDGGAANMNYMVMRCTIGDELAKDGYRKGVRQIVSIGAGMDSRAFRLGLTEATFFEVDTADLFNVKEPLVADVPLQCTRREKVIGKVGMTFDLHSAMAEHGFDTRRPTVWLLEGLAPYLTSQEMVKVAGDIGSLSAPGSSIWLDGFSKSSVSRGMIFHGVPFESGFDNYDEVLLHAGFRSAEVYDTAGVHVQDGSVHWDKRYLVSKEKLKGRGSCLAVRAFK